MSENLDIDAMIVQLRDHPGKIWTTMALEKVGDESPNSYWVRRWWVYVVPEEVDWKPWERNVDRDYGIWRFLCTQCEVENIVDIMESWRAQQENKWNGLTLHFQESNHNYWHEDTHWAYSSPQRKHRLLPYTSRYFVNNNLGWPYQSDGAGPLVADDLPYFPNVREAIRWWIDGVNPVEQKPDNLSQQEFGVWFLDDSPRIKHVTIKSKTVDVVIEGIRGQSAALSMYHAKSVGMAPVTVSRDGSVQLSWDESLSNAEWSLTLGHKVLDCKFFSNHNVWGTNYAVTVEWTDPDRLLERIQQGETMTTEFKRQIPRVAGTKEKTSDLNKAWDTILETVVAFANTDGGQLLIGVDDHGEIVGVQDKADVMKKLETHLRSLVNPSVKFDVQAIDMEDYEEGPRTVVVVNIEQGSLRPYAIERGTDPPKFFIRRGSSDLPAIREELEQLFQREQIFLPPYLCRPRRGKWRETRSGAPLWCDETAYPPSVTLGGGTGCIHTGCLSDPTAGSSHTLVPHTPAAGKQIRAAIADQTNTRDTRHLFQIFASS